MKKIILTLAIIVISLFINTNVYAYERNPELIHDIEKIEITNDYITFEGWGFIGDLNNYGGSSTTIKIIASNNKGKKLSNKDMGNATIYNSTKNNVLYYANCFKWNDKGNYTSGTCIQNNCNPKAGHSPSCDYENVGFTIKFPVDKLLYEFGANEEITFNLEINTKWGNYDVTKSVDIAVHEEVIKNNYSNNNESFTIDFDKPSNIAVMHTDVGRVQSNEKESSDSKIKMKYGQSFIWYRHAKYKIVDTDIVRNDSRFKGLRMYKLEYIPLCCDSLNVATGNGEGCEVCSKGESIASELRNGYAFSTIKLDDSAIKLDYYNTMYNKFGIKTKKEYAWAYASWVSLEGNFAIRFKRIQNCPEEYDSTPKILQCENGTYSQVKNYLIEKTDEVDRTLYPQYNYGNAGSCSSKIERTILGEATVTQKGNATFAITPDQVTSGRGFQISASYNGNAKYEICNEVTYSLKYLYEVEENGKKICHSKVITEIAKEGSQEWSIFTQEAQKLIGEPEHGAKIQSHDSNKVGTEKVTFGSWKATYTNNTKGTSLSWEPGEEIKYELTFSHNKACINRQTSEIRYDIDGTCDEQTEIDGGLQYYTPLKQPTGKFPIYATIRDINILKDQIWSLDYECGVNCNQKLYNEDLSYKFTYRPISLSNPFPNRLPLNNWVKLYEDKDAFTKAMSRDDLEYQVTLTPTVIAKIKQNNKNSKYTSLSGISKTGQSSFLNDLIGTDRTNTFNNLGECNNNCWISVSKLELAK